MRCACVRYAQQTASPRKHNAALTHWLFCAQYNGCAWRGSTLRVERAQEHYTTRLGREWQLAAAAEAARASAAAAATQAAASLATPEALAAARQATGAKLRDTMLLIQSRCTSKARGVSAQHWCKRSLLALRRNRLPHAPASPPSPRSI